MRFLLLLLLVLLPIRAEALYCTQAWVPDCSYPGTVGQSCNAPRSGQLQTIYTITPTASQVGGTSLCLLTDASVPAFDYSTNKLVWRKQEGTACTQTQLDQGYKSYKNYSQNASHASSCPTQPTCSSFTYSDWGACSNNSQSRSITSSLPTGCTGGNPVLTQSCVSEPATCSDGLLTPGEMGIDCGGPCIQGSCEDRCPDGYTLHPVQLINGETVPSSCEKLVDTNYLGLCPQGYDRQQAWSAERGNYYVCSFKQSPTLVAPSSNSDIEDDSPAEFQPKTVTDSVTESVNTVDNGDGTSTRTTTTQYTDNSINRTETKVEIINNANSSIISSVTNGSTTGPAEDNEENYNLAPPRVQDMPSTEFDTTIEAPEQKDIPSLLEGLALSHPLIQVVETLVVDEQSPECSVIIQDDWNGNPVEITFSLCEWENTLKALGAVFLVLTQAYGIMIILGRDKKGGE